MDGWPGFGGFRASRAPVLKSGVPDYLAFFAPRIGVLLALPKSAVAGTFSLIFLGFLASRLPRLLSPFDI